MIRKIIKIDADACDGCGACASACHEGAIEMINGKAVLTREDYCDGLGDCLPACPMNAISFEEREAPAYDHAAVMAAKKDAKSDACPGTCRGARVCSESEGECCMKESCLAQWPVQLKLVPVKSSFYDGADLLVAADCTAFTYGSFHNDFIRGHITLIGCSKLDEVDYAGKLTAILLNNNIKSMTVVRMEVPCCGGIEYAAKRALALSEKNIPLNVVTISTKGKII